MWLEQNVLAVDSAFEADELSVLDPLADNVVGAHY
jgi:hypothetical protein